MDPDYFAPKQFFFFQNGGRYFTCVCVCVEFCFHLGHPSARVCVRACVCVASNAKQIKSIQITQQKKRRISNGITVIVIGFHLPEVQFFAITCFTLFLI